VKVGQKGIIVHNVYMTIWCKFNDWNRLR